MEDLKRKELEIKLRQLINDAGRDTMNAGKAQKITPFKPGNIQVIRRRKGRPDRHITEIE